MKLTPEKLTAFCAALAETCNVTRACSAVGVSRYTAYLWRKNDPDFADRWDEAVAAAVLGLEDEAHRRAFEGSAEPLVHQGQFSYEYERDERGRVVFDEEIIEREVVTKAGKSVELEVVRTPRLALDGEGKPRVSTVRKYSDTLAIFLLKAHNPDKYRENSKVELSGHLATSNMTEDEIREELAAIASSGVLGLAAPDGASDFDEPDDGSDLV